MSHEIVSVGMSGLVGQCKQYDGQWGMGNGLVCLGETITRRRLRILRWLHHGAGRSVCRDGGCFRRCPE